MRTSIRRYLMQGGMPAREADRWCGAWESEAAHIGLDPGSSGFWSIGSAWIADRRHLVHA